MTQSAASQPLVLRFEAGAQTEDLAKYILNALPDEQLDEVEVERLLDPNAETANEPITLGIVLTIAVGAEATVAAIKAVQAISEAVKAYIEYRTKRLEAEAKPPSAPPAPAPETIRVFIVSGEAPGELRALRGNQLLAVQVDRSQP